MRFLGEVNVEGLLLFGLNGLMSRRHDGTVPLYDPSMRDMQNALGYRHGFDEMILDAGHAAITTLVGEQRDRKGERDRPMIFAKSISHWE